MDLVPRAPAGRQVISAYGNGGFLVSGVRHIGSVLVFPDRTVAWPVIDAAAITAESLVPVFAAEPPPEILLLGLGTAAGTLPNELRVSLKAHGAIVESMSTGAACRTYNVLASEMRRVAAALIAIP